MKRRPLGALALVFLFVSVHGAFAYTFFYLEATGHFETITPYVQWYRWEDGAHFYTSIEFNVSMIPDEWTLVENHTYGIANFKDDIQQCGFFVESISILIGRPDNLTVIIYNATDIKATWTTTTWTNLGEADAVPFTMYANEKATLKIMVLAPSDPVDCDVVFKLRVPSEGT